MSRDIHDRSGDVTLPEMLDVDTDVSSGPDRFVQTVAALRVSNKWHKFNSFQANFKEIFVHFF